MTDIFKFYKQKQLKSKEDTFDISQTLYQQVNNDYWREKSNIWHIISAACNDAASEFYVKLKQYVKNLADIDVCTIHNLKSIAQSVDAPHLLDFIDSLQTFPVELRELLDILSIKSSKLLESEQKLHYSSLLSLYGNIDMRSTLYRPQKLPLSLLIDIFDNIDKIEKWFKYNIILPDATIKYIFNKNKVEQEKEDGSIKSYSDDFINQAKIYNEYLNDDSLVWYYGYNELIDNDKDGYYQVIYTKLNDILYLKVEDVINNIKYLKQLINQNQLDIHKGTQLSQLLGFEFKYNKRVKDQKEFIVNTFNTNSIVVQKNGKYILNPFFALIEIVKAKLFASQNGLPMLSYYKEQGDNEVTINMSRLFQNIVQIIKKNDQCYIRNFLFFHIYNLIYSKIINDNLKNDFTFEIKVKNIQTDLIKTKNIEQINWEKQQFFDIDHITYISKYSELTYDQFYPTVSSWISTNEFKEFLGQNINQDNLNITKFKQIQISNKVVISHYKKEYEDFIQYLSLVNIMTKKQQNEDIDDRLPFLIYRYNNDLPKNIQFNQYYRKLLGINEDNTYNENNFIQKVAQYLTDICIKISYVREQIKGLVQQYSFIGTQRIVTDVVRDYFVKNFSKKSSWRYISNLFKDNSTYLKTFEELNGSDNKQFKTQLVEYFDQTAYLNIETDLPPVINGYRSITSTFPSTYILTSDTLSTWTLNEDVTSTVNDRFNFEIPSSLYPQPSMVNNITIPAVTVDGTNLYSQLVSYASKDQNLVTNDNDNINSTTINTSEPITNNFTNYIQTKPTTSVINNASEVFSDYCKNELKLDQTNYQKILNTIDNLAISTVSLTSDYEYDGNGELINVPTTDYYFVVATLKNTSVNNSTVANVTTTVNIPGGSSPSNEDILSTVRFPAPKQITLQPQQTITGEFYNPAASSFIIPKGTEVSAVIPAGTEITTNITSTLQIPIWVDGKEVIKDGNARFWEKNLDYLDWSDLSAQISFYEKYFPQLANACTQKAKLQVYKDDVYPLLTEIWNVNATSGMLDGQNNRIHQQYSGKYPGKQLERNIGNQDFTTIAPLPYIPNLIEVNEYQNDDSYIVKPLYDNISYYMNMFMKQMFNMYKIQAENGLAIAIDGWKQTHIEMKGYCSKYQRSANTIATEGEMNSKLDFDGPWVYSSLKAFLDLKVQNDKISKKNIDSYVDNYFFNLTNEEVKANIKNKLYRYQQEIKNIGNEETGWKLYNFEFDLNDNQHTLFKRKDHYRYEDAGQIWVRMKNFPLSIPLMNRNVVIDLKDIKYQNDVYDTLLCNQRPNYANMFKQMTNNAVQFGIVNNVMWILGWTNYMLNSNQRLMFNKTQKVLRLISFEFKQREDFTLLIDAQSIKSYSIVEQNDKLNNFNEFVGVNYKEKTNSIDFVLYNKNQNKIIIYNYSLNLKEKNKTAQISIKKELIPALQIEQLKDVLIETNNTTNDINLGYTYLISGLNNNINIGTIYSNNQKFIISGYTSKKEVKKYSIYEQVLTGNNSFQYYISYDENSNINLIPLDSPSTTISNITFTSLTNLDIDENNQKLFESVSAITDYANIWRLGADEENTGIAFQTYDLNKDEDVIKSFNIIQQNLSNQKNINNILAVDCELLTKQVIDSSNNIIYMNQIKNINTSIISSLVYLDDNINDYITIQQMFPYCHLKNDNHLVISSIATTLGSYKSLTVNKDQRSVYQENNGMKLLTSIIDPDVTCNDSFEDVITNDNSYFYRNNQRVELKEGLQQYKNIFDGITGTYDFYQYYDKYIEAKNDNKSLSQQKEYLQLYNQQMAKLNDVVAFAPVINEFIIQPLKIIFNFGNEFGFKNKELITNNYFDLDINTYINTDQQKFKKVGWKAGLWQTDYINWITRDERFSGPEIVVIDIEKYKLNNINNYNMNIKDYSIDIIVNACWFIQSQIQSLNPNIFINWKGFTYQYMIEDINTNQDLCDNPFIKIRVGLNNNTLRCYRKVLLPVSLYNKHTKEKLFGFIRVWEDELDERDFIKTKYQTNDWIINIDLVHISKNYQQFEEMCDDPIQSKKILSLVEIYNPNQMYDEYEIELNKTKIKQIKSLKDSLNWNKIMILNIQEENKQFEVHIRKIIV